MTTTTFAAVAVSPDTPFDFRELDLEEPRPDEIKVKIAATGICHTDIAVKEQTFALPLPMVLGHEGAGVVEAVGSDVTHIKVGDHVVLFGDSCGNCRSCRRGVMAYCDEFVERNLSGERMDGTSCMSSKGEPVRARFCGQSSFATYVLASERNAVAIDKQLPLELMGPLGCGITTGMGTVMNGLKPEAGSSIAIFGAGTVGLSAVMGAKIAGCTEIIVIDQHRPRLAMALELGATHVIQASEGGPVEEIQKITGGGANYSIEATGVPKVVLQAVECLAPPGWCAQVGVTPSGITIPMNMDQIVFGRGIRGVVMGEAKVAEFILYLTDLYKQGKLPFDRFTELYDFREIEQAIHDSAVTGEVIKPILKMP